MEIPYEPSCDRNKDSILEVLKEVISPFNKTLLEVGAGSAQHAIYLAPHFEKLQWLTSDVPYKHSGIKLALKAAKIANIHGPLPYTIGKDDFPKQPVDLVFCSNVLHIISWKLTKTFMKTLRNRLREGSQVVFYGPFNYDGKFTSKSNEDFDTQIKQKNPDSGIRSFEDICKVMKKNGFDLCKDYEMPANNRTLVFTRLEHK
jgi:cyclopropane fatty-acyl-phospholipid synthase-like methyltransferase